MRTNYTLSLAISAIFFIAFTNTFACSTFKLQKGEHLLYGHNLNQGDIGVPGLIFINKRGIFKKGKTWSELINKDRTNASSFFWISRYGSVTFNNFGKDLPDGGMNEAGLYIWEMSEDPEYPKNDSLPKLNQMNWMQYILDNCSNLEEALACAYQFEIDGWGWHYFVGDAKGDCAALTFVEGKPVIHKNESMPIPALFNTPYDREMELLKYYKGFGGNYEPDLNDPKVPRFVKTAVMLDGYNPTHDAVDYGFQMLDMLKVNDVPEWSILCDVVDRKIYFKTRINPEIKYFSLDQLDFTNKNPVLAINMDVKQGGEVINIFKPYTNEVMAGFIKDYLCPIIPEEFFTMGGLTVDEYIERFANHTDDSLDERNQFFTGEWKNIPETEEDMETKIIINTEGDAVFAEVYNSFETEKGFEVEHLQMSGKHMKFTFKTKGNSLMEVQSKIHEEQMNLKLSGTEEDYGSYVLYRTKK